MPKIKVDAEVTVEKMGSSTIVNWPDNAPVDWAWAGEKPAANSTPYISEIAIALTQGAPHFGYVNGVLTNLRTNEAVPEQTHNPMPVSWGGGTVDEQVVRLFQWQIENAWMGQQLIIDGNALGQPGTMPGLRFTTAGNLLTLENNVSPPEAPVVHELPPNTTGQPTVIDASDIHGARQYRNLRDFHLVYNNLQPPKVAGNKGKLAVAAMTGGDMLAGVLSIDFGGDAPRVQEMASTQWFSVGEHAPGESFNAAAGANLNVTASGITQDVRVDFQSADY